MTLDHIDIYINNLCNRTCEGCVAYSNFAFTGHYDYKTSEEYLKKWNEIIYIDEINLLGGEPFLHPDLFSWIDGVKHIFNNTKNFVLTTGLGIDQLKHHYSKLEQVMNSGYLLDINVHDQKEFEKTLYFTENVLLKNIEIFKEMQSTESQMYLKNGLEPILYRSNNVDIVRITPAWYFMNNNVRLIDNNQIYFYKSDPDTAFNNCPFKPNCAFLDGRLYKCPSLVTLQNFSKQISCDDKELIDAIETVSPFDKIEKITEYIESFKYPVKQCSMCPEQRHISILSNNVKKIKIHRNLN